MFFTLSRRLCSLKVGSIREKKIEGMVSHMFLWGQSLHNPLKLFITMTPEILCKRRVAS